MGQYLLGIDIGGTGIKAGLFHAGGEMLAMARRDMEILTPASGYAELSPLKIWEDIVSLIDECSREAGVGKNKISSIACSSTCPAVAALDKNGIPLRDVIMNFDCRSKAQVEEVLERAGPDKIFAATGNRLLAGAVSASSIMWIRDNEPDIYRKIFCFGHLTTYIMHRLTGRFVLDNTQASFTGFFRTREMSGWDVELLDIYGIDSEKLPLLLQPWEPAGNISGRAAADTGLKKNTAVAAGAADTVCSALGIGITGPGEVFISSGTSEILSGVLEEPDFEKRFLNRTYIGGKWIYHAPTSTSGAALNWLKRAFSPEDMEIGDFYDHISRLSAGSPAGSGGLFFLPYLQGERSPWWDSDARGVFAGITLGTSRADMFRSVLESIGFALKQNLDIAEKHAGTDYREVLLTGGGSKNRIWSQIKSDITGRVLKIPGFRETAIRGAAMLGGICSGIYRDAEDAVKRNKKDVFTVIEPDMKKHRDYCRLAENFQSLYQALIPEFKKLGTAV